MFVISFKADKKKIFTYMAMAAVVITTVIFMFSSENAEEVSARNTSLIAQTNAQRIAFLKSYGWDVSDEAFEIVEVSIPQEFSDVYENYNKLQKDQGFDLSDYKGKRVKRYTYEVLNYPNEKDVRANLLVYNDKIIGGDIMTTRINGFMHGFKLPR